MKDVGTGGFDGFFGGTVKEVRFHDGGHGAMLGQENLASMLGFLLDDDDHDPPTKLLTDAPAMRRWSHATPFIVICALALLAAGVAYGTATFGWPLLVACLAILAVALIVLDVF